MSYIDGFVIAVPTANRQKFIEHARHFDPLFIELGAIRVIEGWGDDVPDGKVTDFRRAVQATAEGSYRHKKQSGGRGQFGEVHIRVFPVPPGIDPTEFCSKERFVHMREYHYDKAHNFLWVDSIVGG